MKRIYLDHAATTPLRPEVVEVMLPLFYETFGNPSSIHHHGREAKRALREARDQMAELLHCDPNELVYTSGGTESDNLAIIGAMEAQWPQKKHIITTQTEHHAVLHTCLSMEKRGYRVTYLPVDQTGLVNLEQLEQAICDDTGLISVIYGNNETGTLQPIKEIGELAREMGILFHTDAVQALGMEHIRFTELPVDLMSFSSHKINGPKGMGALYIRDKTLLSSQMHGGLQERKRRAGTENVPAIAGFAKALELAVTDLKTKQLKMEEIRLHMIEGLRKELGEDQVIVNGHPAHALPHILNVSFLGTTTESLLMNLDLAGISASSGSACTSGSFEVSHVLKAMHLPDSALSSALRFSFGWGIELEEIERAVKIIATVVQRLRNK